MDFSLNEEQQQIREMVHDLCLERVEPRAAEIDESGEFPWDVKELFAKHDILAIPFTPEYGGISGSALTLIVAVEEISKFCVTSSLILSVQSVGSLPIWLAGNVEKSMRGFKVGKLEKKRQIRGSRAAKRSYEDLEGPEYIRLGG